MGDERWEGKRGGESGGRVNDERRRREEVPGVMPLEETDFVVA